MHTPRTVKPIAGEPQRFEMQPELDNGASTRVYIARYSRKDFLPRVVVFDRPTRLLDWCDDNGISEAVAGGFFSRERSIPLGDVWTSGYKHPSMPITSPWESIRGALHLDGLGEIAIGPRSHFPENPSGDLLQAGPVLVRGGVNQVEDMHDSEGLTAASHQFDSDITADRHPRSAIGISDEYFWSVVCDGRSPESTGMHLHELAGFMIQLGAKEALNLDGGGSASLVSGGTLLNTARGDGVVYERGRTILTAVAFVQK